MKRIIFSIVIFTIALLSLTVAKAHTPTQQCSNPGWYSYIWSALGNSKSVEITWGQGHHGEHYATIIKNLQIKPITLFRAPVGQDVTFVFSDGYETHFVVKQPKCGALPATLYTFEGKDEGNGRIDFTWIVNMETNVDRYEVWQSLPDSTERVIAVVKSKGDSSIQVEYTASKQYAGDINACMSCLLGIGFLLGFIRKLRKKALAVVIILSVGLISCTKETAYDISRPEQIGYFRLKSIDRDGTVSNHNFIQIKTH